MLIYTYTCSCRIHTNTINKQTSEDFLIKICTSHFICNVCMWEGVGDQTELQYIDPHSYGHQHCVFLVLLMLNRRPGGSTFCFRGWLSLPHLISNFSGPQLIRGSKGPIGLVWLSLPHLVYNSSWLQLSDFLSWLSYIIVQRPLNRLLDLWNGMFDHHQAEITVMQFTGHSLPVHQSMSVPWEF